MTNDTKAMSEQRWQELAAIAARRGGDPYLAEALEEIRRLRREVSGVREVMGRQIEDLTKGRHWKLERERAEVWRPLLEAAKKAYRKAGAPGDGPLATLLKVRAILNPAIARAEKALEGEET